MIRLHQFEISPFCDKIRRCLHVKGQPYEVREVPMRDVPRIRRINPIGKLPCLEHDGRFLADSTEIAEHLEDAYPEPPLYPSDPAQRALCQVFEDWADESLYFYELYLRLGLPHNAKRWIPVLLEHDPAWVARIAAPVLPYMMKRTARAQGIGRKPLAMVLRDLDRHVASLAGLLDEREWLVGDAVSIADISVFAQLHCIRGTDEGAKAIGASPAVTAWMDRTDRTTAPPG